MSLVNASVGAGTAVETVMDGTPVLILTAGAAYEPVARTAAHTTAARNREMPPTEFDIVVTVVSVHRMQSTFMLAKGVDLGRVVAYGKSSRVAVHG